MAVPREEDVVRLDVTVDVAHVVDGLDGQHNLGHVEARHVLVERIVEARREAEQVAAGVVVHHEVEERLVLEAVVQLGQELAAAVEQDPPLLAKAGRLPKKTRQVQHQGDKVGK